VLPAADNDDDDDAESIDIVVQRRDSSSSSQAVVAAPVPPPARQCDDDSDVSEMSSGLLATSSSSGSRRISSSSSSSDGNEDDRSDPGSSRAAASYASAAASLVARRQLLGSTGSLSTFSERSSGSAASAASGAAEQGQQQQRRLSRTSSSRGRLQVLPPGCVGLSNIGNSCYANSILQALNCCPEFVAALLGPEVLQHRQAAAAEADGGSSSEALACRTAGIVSSAMRCAGRGMWWRPGATVGPALCELLREMWGGQQQPGMRRAPVSPRKLLSALGRVDARWGAGVQQDAQEFIIALLQRLQEEGNTITSKPPYRELSGKGDEAAQAAEAAAAAAAWNASVIDELLGAQLQSTITCGGCGQASHNFNSFLGDLAVPLPASSAGKGVVTLQV
jgi:ubiquitin carboxyl-terminal hydrolase 4/11/15